MARVWNCISSGSEISNFGARNLVKIALSAEYLGFSSKFRPLITIVRALENGHSICHQSIPPLTKCCQSEDGAALKGTNVRGQMPICGFSASSSGFLRKSAPPNWFVLW